jgi:predicted TIM-barrel fold metal-dependent hydrolase
MVTGKIVDAHHHLWDLANDYPWLTDRQLPGMDVTPFARTFLVDDYLSDAKPIEVVRSVHVQAGWDPADPVGETRWLTEVASRTGHPDAIVAFVDLAADHAEQAVEAHAASPLLRGVRMLLTWHPDPRLRRARRPDFLTDASWLRGLGALADRDLSFDMQIFAASQATDAAGVARNFGTMRFILDHLGLPVDPSPDAVRDWKAGLARLATCSNVAVKLSGFTHFVREWSIETVRPFIDFAVSEFGPDRCLFGSNFPVERPLVAFPRLVGDVATIVGEHGDDAVEGVFATNAIEWYRLDG